jgi:hypothetical protein
VAIFFLGKPLKGNEYKVAAGGIAFSWRLCAFACHQPVRALCTLFFFASS